MDNDDRTTEPLDPAAAAFSRLEGEIALMRRAVENLAAEKANIDVPDYSATLAQMAEHMDAANDILQDIVGKPAWDMTPESVARRMDQAARSARQSDREQIAAAETRYDHAMRDLTNVVASARSASYQREYLRWAACGGVLAGCLLWAIVPGPIARSLPESWHMPEKIAMRTLRAPSVWEAGVRMLRAGSPEAWRAISDAAVMRGQNKETIAACEKNAAKRQKPVRCTINIKVPSPGSASSTRD